MAEAELAGEVDVLGGGDARLVELGGLDDQGRDEAGGDEAGHVAVDDDAGLAGGLGELPGPGEGFVAGLVAPDQFAELHHRDRREEVRADDPLRPLGDGGDLGDRDGGGVRGEHRVLADQLVEGAEDLVLDVELFEDGLDHDVGVGGAFQVGRGGDPAERRLGVLGGELALGDEPVEGGLDAVRPPRQGGVGDVAQDDVPARLGGDLSDSRTHESGSDDGELACHDIP